MLEPGRSLLLAERGGAGAEQVTAHPMFRLVATMNPGDDLGKRELSPALANRFTTVWVPALDDLHELGLIVQERLQGEWGCASACLLCLGAWGQRLSGCMHLWCSRLAVTEDLRSGV